MVLVFWGFWFCCFGLVLCFWCLVGVFCVGCVFGGLQRLHGYMCGVLVDPSNCFYGFFCVEKLRNLDLCLFGAVTFVTFCYIYIDSRGSRGLCLYGFLGVVALGNPSKH